MMDTDGHLWTLTPTLPAKGIRKEWCEAWLPVVGGNTLERRTVDALLTGSSSVTPVLMASSTASPAALMAFLVPR